MIADRKDVAESAVNRHREASAKILPLARVVAGAAPVMDKLQRSEEWGRYVTYLQGMAERFATQKQGALSKLSDPAITEDREIRKLRQDIFIADVTIGTLKFAIELPAAILQGNAEATDFIAKFEKKNEPTAEAKS